MDEKYAPLFTWSKGITDEFRRFKLNGKCPNCGVRHWSTKSIQLVKSDGTVVKPSSFLGRLERDTYVECKECHYKIPICVPLEETDISETEKTETKKDYPVSISEREPVVKVHWLPQEKKIQVASEVINVPSGVTITVKRSRTIEHTIDINWKVQGGINVSAGIKQIISATVHGELEKSRGRTYHESEKIEYEIELNGEKNNRYKLIWIDVWIAGNSEISEGNTTTLYPFEFRERSELAVTAIND